jgi:cleavage and polyadenylation specificity factor subunit 1
VYQGLALGQNQAEPIQEPRASHLDVKFVKVTSIAFEILQRYDSSEHVTASSSSANPGSAAGEKGSTSTTAGGGAGGGSGAASGGSGSSILAEHKKIPRVFVPFVTTPPVAPNPGGAPSPTTTTYSGVFFTGDRPNWIFGTDHGGVQIYPSGHSVVNAFTTCSMWEGRGDFLMYTEDVRISGSFYFWIF